MAIQRVAETRRAARRKVPSRDRILNALDQLPTGSEDERPEVARKIDEVLRKSPFAW